MGSVIGDDAGFLNFAKIKGSHTAMKSGMLCMAVEFKAASMMIYLFKQIGCQDRNPISKICTIIRSSA
ncbi:hypothetical protein ACBO_09850 [Acinetobacter bouvetii]|nr:hypothetical protein ACBO_09850 [Acinetobacter bouvetii]